MDSQQLTIPQICKLIDLLHPCMDDYLYVYDFVNDYYHISPHATDRFMLPADSFNKVVAEHSKFVYPKDVPALQDDLAQMVSGQKHFHNLQYRWLSRQNEIVWINCRGYVVDSPDTHKPAYMIGCINEIGEKQKADNVSGLLGIATLKDYFDSHIDIMPNGYIMRFGIDDFKEINEKMGNDYGDILLRHIAECMESCKLSGQAAYRALSDEFILIDFQGRDVNNAIKQFERIRNAIDDFIENSHYETVFTISCGILPCSNVVGQAYTEIMKFSEFALNEAKKKGKNISYVFDYQDYKNFLRRREITQLLRRSINNNFEGFDVFLQPLYNVDTDSLYGAEALMRFSTEKHGMISPMEFVPILEETGLIVPAGKWILHRALTMSHEIQKVLPNFKISINISYIQVLKSNIISEIISAVSQHEVAPRSVIIELTESGSLTSDTRVTKLWSKLKKKGIHLALDDFGTGSSNFQYLNDLKPDLIKIDRSFTVKALENDYEYNLLSFMSNMVHGLHLKMCIEGIENSDELSRMRALSPDYCQGYYFGKPCSYEQFIKNFVETATSAQ